MSKKDDNGSTLKGILIAVVLLFAAYGAYVFYNGLVC